MKPACLKRLQSAALGSVLLVASSLSWLTAAPEAQAAITAEGKSKVMTLKRLQNSSYQIPDLSCGYKAVKLVDGKGHNEDGDVVFGRAAFGDLDGDGRIDAIVHLAFRVPESPWMQQIIFILDRSDRLMQVADYSLDDSAEMRGLEIKSGEATVTYRTRSISEGSEENGQEKLVRFRLSGNEKSGRLLKASEWQIDPATRELRPYVDRCSCIY